MIASYKDEDTERFAMCAGQEVRALLACCVEEDSPTAGLCFA